MTRRQSGTYPILGFGQLLREAREAKGLTLQQLGDIVRIKKSGLWRYEAEHNFPSNPTIIKLSEALSTQLPMPHRNKKGRRAIRTDACPVCGSDYPVYHGEKYCSRSCANIGVSRQLQGERCYNWKGGRTVDLSGYVHIMKRGHPRANERGYVREHIVVMEGVIGRHLLPTERVHHKNGNRADNRPENLELWRIRKDPPGQRVEDLINDIMGDNELQQFDEPVKAALRRIITRVLFAL